MFERVLLYPSFVSGDVPHATEGGYLVVRDIEDNYKPVINVSYSNTYLIGFLTGRPYEKDIDIDIGSGNGNKNENIYWGISGGVIVILAVGFTLVMWKVVNTIITG